MSKSNSLAKRIFAAAVSAALLFSVAMTGCSNSSTEESNTSQTTEAESSVVSIADVPDAVKSESYQISLAMMSYFLNDIYSTNATTWQYYYGFDPTKSLKEQYIPNESSDSEQKSWYDYLIQQVKAQVKEVMLLAEMAKDDGMTLTDEEKETVQQQIDSFSTAAESESISIEEYIQNKCGPGITSDDLKNYTEMMVLAQKYYEKLTNSFTYEDADYDKYYQENRESFLYGDYISYTFSSSLGDDASDAEKDAEAKELKKYADELAKCTTEETFKAYVKKYLTEHPELITAEISSSSSSSSSSTESSEPTQEEITAAIETKVNSLTKTKYAYETSSGGGKWLFDDSRNKGDTTVIETDGSYTTVCILKTAYRDEAVRKNVRHILLSTEDQGSEDAAQKKADEVYAEWKNGAKTEESFAELAGKYSNDSGSSSNGGLYENVYEGQMVDTFNDWCFDESRKVGDTGIVKTTYGYHIMYFVGDAMPEWKATADSAMRYKDSYTEYEKKAENYQITFKEDALSTIDVVVSTS